MKISEVNLDLVKTYCRIDGSEDDILLQMYLDSAKKHMADYIGCTVEHLDTKLDLTPVLLALVAEMERNREFGAREEKENIFFEKMLGKHAMNLL